jgi:hypothetical protein
LIKKWLTHGRKQRVNGTDSDWEEILSGIPQGSILGPLLFITFINDLELGITNSILKFADDTKLFGGAGTREAIEQLRMDLLELYVWSEKWQMNFNIEKCKVMHIGVNNTEADYDIARHKLEKVNEEKDLGVIVSKNFKVGGQCTN